MDYLHITEAELGINLDIPLSEHDHLDKLNDLANKKRKHADDIYEYFKANKRLKSLVHYEDHLPGPGLDDHAKTINSLLLAEVDKRNLNPLKQMRILGAATADGTEIEEGLWKELYVGFQKFLQLISLDLSRLATTLNRLERSIHWDQQVIYSMAGEDEFHDDNPPPPVTPTQQASHTLSTIKLPILKKDILFLSNNLKAFLVSPLKMPIKSFLDLYLSGPKYLDYEDQPGVDIFASRCDAKEPVGLDKTRSKGNQEIRRRDARNTGYKAKDNVRRHRKQEEPKALAQTLSIVNSQGLYSSFKKVEAQLVAHQKNQLWYEEKIRFIKIDLDDKTDVLTYHRSSDLEDSPMNDRFAKVEGMHAVPPPMTGIYMPSKTGFGIDESNFSYGPKQSKTSESDAKTSDFDSCESNSSVETPDSMPKLAVNEPTNVSKLKVWSDAPIIEEYESDSDDEYVIKPSKEQEKTSFAFVNTVKHVKTPKETVKEQNTYSPSPKSNKRDWNGLMSKKLGLGYGFTKKACFVCGSFSHLIRDCDFHEKKMAKQVELNKQKGKGTSQRENRPVWNNVQRLNHQNKFFPKAVLTKTAIFPVNAARQNPSSQAAETSTARKVNTARPIVNEIRQRNNFYKSHSPIRRPFNRTTAPKENFTNLKVNTAGDKTVSAVGGYREIAIKASAGCNWRPKRHYWNKVSKYNSGSEFSKHDDPQKDLKNKGIIDSGCSRHMTGNKAYFIEYQDYNGGPIAFGGSKSQITGKGKIITRKLDFKDVYFVKELKQFNLFSVSQMCDKKNKVLFTYSERLVLSPDFKLPDENQVLLRVPRQNNMFSFN
ncbi:hypothetical protein Tco_1049994 [Tanacetum coccineum]